MRRQAHTIKGAAANLQASLLAQTASLLEEAGEAEELGKAASLIPQLDGQFERLKETLSGIRPVQQYR